MKTFVRIIFKTDTMAELMDLYLNPAQCGPDVAKLEEYKYGGGKIGFDVEIKLDEGDERIAKICALLTKHDEYHGLRREDVYTEEDLQNAPLLELTGGGGLRQWSDCRSAQRDDLRCLERLQTVWNGCAPNIRRHHSQ